MPTDTDDLARQILLAIHERRAAGDIDDDQADAAVARLKAAIDDPEALAELLREAGSEESDFVDDTVNLFTTPPKRLFAEEDWTRQQGPRGGTFWMHNKTGEKVYAQNNPGGKARQKEPGDLGGGDDDPLVLPDEDSLGGGEDDPLVLPDEEEPGPDRKKSPGQGTTVEPADNHNPQVLASLFGGHAPGDEQLAAMACAVPGAKVEILALANRDGSNPALQMEWFHEGANATRVLAPDEDGKLVCHNELINIKDDSPHKGQGANLFAAQVKQLQAAGVNRIETSAARSSDMIGYHVWPLLGYNAKIPRKDREKMPPEIQSHLKAGSTLLDLYALPGGRDWWKKNGKTMDMTFDLKPGSRSQKVLEAYLEQRKQRPAS